MRYLKISGAALALALLIAGCSQAVSPLVGKWSGKSDMKDKGIGTFVNSLEGGPLTGPSSMTLDSDGKGFLKVADQPERPITWKQDGGKLLVSYPGSGSGKGTGGGSDASAVAANTYVGTLSNDQDTVVIDMDKVKVTLNRQKSQ